MEIPASYLMFVIDGILVIFAVFSLFNLFHLVRFGLVGPGGLIAIGLYLAVAALLVSKTFTLMNESDWSAVWSLPFSVGS